jgi:hypothetical protein
MTRLEQWQALGVVCGSLIALLTLVGLIYRWVVRPVWRTLRRLNEVADQLLGDKVRKIPSMTERMASLEQTFGEHLQQHQVYDRTNGPARPVRQQK